MDVPVVRSRLLLSCLWQGMAAERLCAQNPAKMRQEVYQAEVKGRGGMFFPVEKKWELALQQAQPLYLIVNGGGGGMGSFKNHLLLTQLASELFLGIKLVQVMLSPKKTFFYLSRHYLAYYSQLREAARAVGCEVIFHKGSYHPLNGEETAQINELEGKPAQPRRVPPYPALKGYGGKPTITHSLELFLHIAYGFLYGWEKWAETGDSSCRGSYLLSLSGDVEKKGVAEIAWGEPLETLFEGEREKPAYLFIGGGCSALLRPYKAEDVFSLAQEWCRPGLGNVVAFSERRCLFRFAYTVAKTFEQSSCGRCAACTMGNHNIAYHLRNAFRGIQKEEELLQVQEIVHFMPRHGDCAFIDMSASFFQNLIEQADFENHRKGVCKKCQS